MHDPDAAGTVVVTAGHRHVPLFLCSRCGGNACGTCGLCANCDHAPPTEDGVLRLVESPHPFYEGAYDTQVHFDEAALRRLSGPLILPFVHFGYLKHILDNVAPGAEVLELGCGGGMMLAAQRFSVTAVDLSLAALLSTPRAYRHRLQADVMEIQFLPARFDAIFASCFFEHFAHEQKEMLLERWFTWLRSGGKLILLFDTESRNPLFRWLRRYPDLYRRCFVEHDGHLGLEPVSVNRARFAAHGFTEVKGLGLNRTAQHLPVCGWLAPYQAVSRWAGPIARAAELLRRNSTLARVFTGAIHLWDLTLGRLFPEDWSRLYLGVWERPQHAVPRGRRTPPTDLRDAGVNDSVVQDPAWR